MRPVARRRIGIAAGIVLGSVAIAVLVSPGCEHLHAPGPMNTGHGELACSACHVAAPGTLRQQLQAMTRSWLGLGLGIDQQVADLGFLAVANDACLACHERPDDRHPVSRFLEPRFARARAALHPEACTSCHREHRGVRVTAPEPTYCRHCHGELSVPRDPLDVPHRELVASERWETCLGCHDFHGNHAAKPPTRLRDAVSAEQIRAYFAGGPSPYGPAIRRAIQPRPHPEAHPDDR